MNDGFNILIVDDEPNIRSGLAKGLAKEADTIETAGNVNEALDKFDAGDYQLVIADVRLPGDRDGLDLISLLLRRCTGNHGDRDYRSRHGRNRGRCDAPRARSISSPNRWI